MHMTFRTPIGDIDHVIVCHFLLYCSTIGFLYQFDHSLPYVFGLLTKCGIEQACWRMLNITSKLAQFRQQVYLILGRRADSKIELLDALCSHDGARSVAELSLTPVFRRHYSALYKAMADLELQDTHLQALAARRLPAVRRFPFWLLGVDVTPAPRPFAVAFSGRQVVYQPTAIPGQRPLTLGHQYSSVTLLLPEGAGHRSWVAPLSVQRVDWPQDKEMIGNQQV